MDIEKKKTELFKMLDQINPFSSFQTEYGYLKFSDKQKLLLQKKVFTPNKHIFAALTIHNGIEFYEKCSKYSAAFEKYVEEYEANKDDLPFVYIGLSDENGKINIETLM